MSLIKCPECKNKVWGGAATCPSCGYPVAPTWEHGSDSYVTPTPLPAKRSDVAWLPAAPVQTTFQALKQIATRIVTGGVLFVSGVEFEAPPVIIVSVLMGISCIPIWWRARKVALGGGNNPQDLSARIDELERELEDRQLQQMDDFQDRQAQRLAELEERLDFAERLLTRQSEAGSGEGG